MVKSCQTAYPNFSSHSRPAKSRRKKNFPTIERSPSISCERAEKAHRKHDLLRIVFTVNLLARYHNSTRFAATIMLILHQFLRLGVSVPFGNLQDYNVRILSFIPMFISPTKELKFVLHNRLFETGLCSRKSF